MTIDQFNSWFVEPVLELQRLRAGFPQMLIIMPLLERYLRYKSGIAEADKLDDRFFRELRAMFPVLKSDDDAKDFWQIFRNGLLHQATLSKKPKPSGARPPGALSFEVDLILRDAPTDAFIVNPCHLAGTVLSAIQRDFATFEASSGTRYPLPHLAMIGYYSSTSN